MEGSARQLRLRYRSVVVIPARMASSRLPGKMLLRETGRSLIQHTYEAACRATRPLEVWIATDHTSIAAEVKSFGGQARMTDPELPSGTDRVAEVARSLDNVDVIVNLQGDEPELPGEAIDLAIELLEQDPAAVMSTLATPIRCRSLLDDPACVKVVLDSEHRALYFSRSPIPHPREWSDDLLSAEPPLFHQHIGLYAYRKEFLLNLAALPPAACERVERLEQLRVLAAGHTIRVGIIPAAGQGIDTAADYRAFVERTRRVKMSCQG